MPSRLAGGSQTATCCLAHPTNKSAIPVLELVTDLAQLMAGDIQQQTAIELGLGDIHTDKKHRTTPND
ncbi:MAG: hypothetical protein ACXW0T_11225 [Methylobacter sp.]